MLPLTLYWSSNKWEHVCIKTINIFMAYCFVLFTPVSSMSHFILYSGTSINDHLQRATTCYKTAKNSCPDWNYNDFQPLRNGHLSTPYNEQLTSPLISFSNLPERTATPRISRKLLHLIFWDNLAVAGPQSLFKACMSHSGVYSGGLWRLEHPPVLPDNHETNLAISSLLV